MSSKNNSYANTDTKTLFLSDDVDNESIGALTWSILQQIREDDEKDEKEKEADTFGKKICAQKTPRR